jgi:hypothetical protein
LSMLGFDLWMLVDISDATDRGCAVGSYDLGAIFGHQ